jgi:hypothetical protein
VTRFSTPRITPSDVATWVSVSKNCSGVASSSVRRFGDDITASSGCLADAHSTGIVNRKGIV